MTTCCTDDACCCSTATQRSGVSRRGFLALSGAGLATALIASRSHAATALGVPEDCVILVPEDDRQIMQMIYSQNLFGRPYLMPPGVPADRVAALRAAFAAMLQDKALLADAERLGLDIGPLGGEELQALVARLYALPPKIIARAKQSLIYKSPAR